VFSAYSKYEQSRSNIVKAIKDRYEAYFYKNMNLKKYRGYVTRSEATKIP